MRKTWYALAHDVWQGAKWVWTAIVIAILVSVASSVFAGKQVDVSNTTAIAFIIWLRTFGFYQILILSFIGLFVVVSLASGLTTFILSKNNEPTYTPPPEVQTMLDYLKKDVEATQRREEVQQALEKAAFTQYLRSIEEMCETISPRGFAQLSRALIFIDVPLEAAFVHLHVVSDEPIYDAPGEQQRQLEAMRKRTDLSREERDVYLQGLRIIWQSQLRRDTDEEQWTWTSSGSCFDTNGRICRQTRERLSHSETIPHCTMEWYPSQPAMETARRSVTGPLPRPIRWIGSGNHSKRAQARYSGHSRVHRRLFFR